MLTKILFPILALLAMLALWLGVQALARRTAQRHPEYGPFREAGGGCGGGKGCGSASCPSPDQRCEH
jgi:hypothetical protein